MNIKTWIQNFIGTSEIKSKLHNMDADIIGLMDKQLNPLMTLPGGLVNVDPPECDPNSPYEYVLTPTFKLEPGSVNYMPEWYCIWIVGFAGPFPTEDEAKEYARFNKIKNPHIEQLHKYGFHKK